MRHKPEERRSHLSEPGSEGVSQPGVASIAGEEGGDEGRGQLGAGRGGGGKGHSDTIWVHGTAVPSAHRPPATGSWLPSALAAAPTGHTIMAGS